MSTKRCIHRFFAGRPASVPYVVVNDCHCCAERKMLRQLVCQSRKCGVQPSCVSWWIHRKFGSLVVFRTRADGTPGISIPCVICRKTLDKNGIQWKAHIGEDWYRSSDPDVPKSRPTQKQKHKLGFK